MTVNVPLALLNQVDEAALDWLVPGMMREKVAWTMKALPKRIRTLLVPVPEHVTRFLERVKPGRAQDADEVLAYASRIAGERLDADVWSKDDCPAHLRMNLRVVDDAKRELAMGRDLGELRERLGEAAQLTLAQSRPGLEREGIRAWDFGDLPAEVTFRRGNQALTGYPALADEGESVADPPLRHEGKGGRSASRRREAAARLRAEGAGEAARARPPGIQRARAASSRP